jgi:hypothetical protein
VSTNVRQQKTPESRTVDGVEDSKFTSGRIALQYGAGAVKDKGVVKFRKVEIKPL